MAVFDGNVPASLCAEERPEFVRFLTHHAAAWHYHVIERAGELVACAGYSISTGGTTESLGWGMVHPLLQRQGLVTQLLMARLEAIRLTPDIERVVLDTSRHTHPFYARFGLSCSKSCRIAMVHGLDRGEVTSNIMTLALRYLSNH
ncbi:GNAT family N-acetyltransferase [Xanthomonas hortorum pv. vitians]|nr:GNAT family N-acetyltransferase [Xanthomonas floridensis]MEA5123472.1 GNAT family N-acetyltransferase [Xanthomonas floridensis]MEA5133065.1 GNAT family N-acetyltransferase [Xanthomonas floridensis]